MKLFLIAISMFFISLTMPALAASTTNNDLFKACNGVNSDICQDRTNQNGDSTNANPINKYIKVGANITAILTGLMAIIFIIISAFKLVTGGGSPESLKSARSTLISAVIGLVIITLAWTIINFAVTQLIKN